MKMWGLSVISLGGFMIMTSQIQANPNPLIISGLAVVVTGVVMFLKGKSDSK